MELMSLSVRRGGAKVITARNYVGLIAMNDGTVIEILPKIANVSEGAEESKNIFLEMLKSLKDISFKDFNMAKLGTDRLSLFEIFITMFLDEVTGLVQRGLSAGYTAREANEHFYKGKLLFAQDIKNNLVNKERFFVRYDEFNTNRPENRLIKTTLRFLLGKSTDSRNRQSAARLLNYFDSIPESVNVENDFAKCLDDRSMTYYAKALAWCRVFLRGNSFTTYAGNEVAFALLFPMDKVFESYVAAKLRKLVDKSIELKIQDSQYSLFDQPQKTFRLRPDLTLKYPDGSTVVMDTKWKLLTGNSSNNYGISQADMYQMYAYGKKYQAKKVVLVYPRSPNLSAESIPAFKSNDGVIVEIAFIDLLRPDESFEFLLQNTYLSFAI